MIFNNFIFNLPNSKTFKSVEAIEENVSGMGMLTISFIAFLLLIFFYIFCIERGIKRIEKKIDSLERGRNDEKIMEEL